MELRPEPLPVPADWQAATSRAQVLFGIQVSPYLTAAGLAQFTESLRTRVDAVADSAASLAQRVELAYRHLDLSDDRPGRLATARAGASLLEALHRAGGGVRLVETLAQAAFTSTDTAVANSLSRAPAVTSAVDTFRWDRLAPLRAAENQGDDSGRAAARVLTALREALAADEFATRLGPALSQTDDAIFEWLSRVRPPSLYHPRPPGPGGAGRATRAKGAPASEVLGPLQAFLNAHRDEQVVVEWRVQE
jgi:hypothetical protein